MTLESEDTAVNVAQEILSIQVCSSWAVESSEPVNQRVNLGFPTERCQALGATDPAAGVTCTWATTASIGHPSDASMTNLVEMLSLR